ncbi:S-adenosyl-L-methionine-dependent methyltransferase [Mycena latifolia]|nr:S-adenosyl-L-methionine-dependent methyltransferase [Mycena latifolia]
MGDQFYVLLPPLPQTPRKRKASEYPTPPSTSGSSTTSLRCGSPNPSPEKKQKGGRDTHSVASIIDFTKPSSDIVYLEEEELGLKFNDSTSDSEKEVPIRRLSDFSIYKDQNLVYTTELLGGMPIHSIFTASGTVRAHYIEDNSGEDSEDEEDEDAYPVRGLRITDFNVHHISRSGELDGNIYIETPHAYYILASPSCTYRDFFLPFWLRYKFTHLIVSSAMADPRMTYEKFVDSLSDPLTESQLKSVEITEYFESFLAAIVHELKQKRKRNIINVPLVKTLQSRQFSEHLEIPKKLTNVETLVTPVVGSVIVRHVKGSISVLGSGLGADQVLVEQPSEMLNEHDDPTTMHWGKPLRIPGYYESVVIDGVKYQVDDVVSVNPGEDVDAERSENAVIAAEFCTNSYARRVWFIKIQYLFDDEMERDSCGQPTKKLHGVWFAHESQTILQEVAGSQELFVLEECDDINVSSIFRKCDVRQLRPEEEPPNDGDENATSYFYKCVSDGECEWKDTPDDEEEKRLKDLLPAHKACINCGLVVQEQLHRELRLFSGGFTRFGLTYHVFDFIFVKPDTNSASPLCIGQIEDIRLDETGDVHCQVRYFKRYTEESMDFKDNRRLYRSRIVNVVQPTDIDGVCYVKFIEEADVEAIEAWIKEDSDLDRFYVNERKKTDGELIPMDEESFKICRLCVDKYEREMADMERYHLANPPFDALSIFSGPGGLSEGLRRTGFFKTRCAIEQSRSAAQTFAANNPETDVLDVDANAVLRYMVDREEGKTPAPLRRSDGSIIPDEAIPRPGDVDIVEGGSPCQPFSGANFFRKEDDPRTLLPYTLLSFVEVLKPRYFLFENVTGLLHHSLSSDAPGKRINMAAVKLMCKILLALSYQVHFKILQAGQYGTPQDRERVIFLAAKHGHKLPEFPTPTHVFFKPARRFKIPMGRNYHIRPPTRSKADEIHLFAAHPAVTINDAIGDLRAFDWLNPHNRIGETPADVAERRQRMRDGILQCKVSKGPVEFPEPVAYATRPQTRYQKAMRGSQDALVEHHVTQAFSDLVVESTTMVPLRPWSTHRFLPDEILPDRMKKPGDSTTFYGRLDGAAHFKTAMTTPKPNGNKSYFIHPTQKRALSLREFARSQGFPDNYILCSSEATPSARLKDYFKQIGNAVPLPLAAALGRSIGAASVCDWKEKRKRGRSVEC